MPFYVNENSIIQTIGSVDENLSCCKILRSELGTYTSIILGVGHTSSYEYGILRIN